MKEIGKTKYDVDDREKYSYLDPLWEVLENIPSDTKITMDKAGEQSGLDPKKAVPLIQQLCIEFQQKMMKHMFSLIFAHDDLTKSWTFDKIMLVTTRVDTGRNVNDDIDPKMLQFGLPVMKKWEEKWRERKGV